MREEDNQQSQPKRSGEKWFAEVVGDTCAEGVGEGGEEEGDEHGWGKW